MKKRSILNGIINIYTFLGFLLILASIGLIIVPTSPYIWYRINPQATQDEVKSLRKSISSEEYTEENSEEIISINLPEIDSSLPEGYFIEIPSIKVFSPISDDPDYEYALDNGSWLVPEYGTPLRSSNPIIIAAHRFGYQYWSKEKRELISFFNLPKTVAGDEVIIYWGQRKFTYKIYASEENTYITDYNADLILYTCKYFNSPLRIFRYANLVE